MNLPCGRGCWSDVTVDKGRSVLVLDLDGHLDRRRDGPLDVGDAEEQTHLAHGDDGSGGDHTAGDSPFADLIAANQAFADDLKAPVLGLYGGKDQGIPLASVERMRQALARAGLDGLPGVGERRP